MILDDLEDLTPIGVDNLGAKQVTLKTKGGGGPLKSGSKQVTANNVIIKPDSPSKFDNIEEDEYDEEQYEEEDDEEYDEEGGYGDDLGQRYKTEAGHQDAAGVGELDSGESVRRAAPRKGPQLKPYLSLGP
jgi:hypothetical protein